MKLKINKGIRTNLKISLDAAGHFEHGIHIIGYF
jgi:hypothetical protein